MKVKGNILLLDDDQLVLMNNVDIVESAGFATTTVVNLRQALTVVKQRNFDLILCDHDLPDGKGVDLVNWLLHNDIDTPIVYLSAAPSNILDDIAKFKNVHKILSKPVTENELIKALDECIKVSEDNYYKLISKNEREFILDSLNL